MAAGDYKGAIKGFRELAKTKKEQDPVLLMQLAGALLKVGKVQEAKVVYSEVGTYFGDRGFFNKSVAAFKKALNITPGDREILEKLSSYNDKVPKFMIDANILAQLKKQAETHNTGEHPAMTAAEVEATLVTQETKKFVESGQQQAAVAEDTPAPAVINEEPIKTAPVYVDPTQTAELDRNVIMEAAKRLVKPKQPQPAPTPIPKKEVLDNSEEEILDISVLDEADENTFDHLLANENDGFVMDFGEAQAPETKPLKPLTPAQAPEKPAAPPAEKKQTSLGQPLTRGGMVFKSQKEPPKPTTGGATGFFDSVDDALDNIFAGAGGGDGDGDLFGLDDSMIDAVIDFSPEGEQVELTLADASPEENAKHWPLFRTMPQDVFMALVLALETRDYEAGELIVSEGDPGDEMYLIAEGDVEIIVTIGGMPTKVASLSEGDFFGEASLLSGAPRNATVRTLTTTNCLLLSTRDLNKLVGEHPSVMASIESIYYTRIQENASRKHQAGK